MDGVLLIWAVAAVVLLVLAALLGRQTSVGTGLLGILVDGRGRYSLNHLQLVLWTIVILSLVAGIFFGRLIEGAADPLGFTIPAEVLGLLGISLGSSLIAGATKSSKDQTAGERIAASNAADKPRLAQIFLAEEGLFADKVIDIAKFQNFVITLILVVTYAALAIDEIVEAKTATEIGLPTFSPTFLTLLGISHAAYVAGKIPSQSGTPPGLTVGNRKSDDQLPENVTARNPGQ
jgi:hypothetical protein